MTYVGLLVRADGDDVGSLGDGLASHLERHHFLGADGQRGDHVAVRVQLLPQLLHALQQALALVQGELRVGVHSVQLLVAPATTPNLLFRLLPPWRIGQASATGGSRQVGNRGMGGLACALQLVIKAILKVNYIMLEKNICDQKKKKKKK